MAVRKPLAVVLTGGCLTLFSTAACAGDVGREVTPLDTAPSTHDGIEAPPNEANDPTAVAQQAQAAAKDAVQRYLASYARVGAHPDRDIAQLEQVASGDALDSAQQTIRDNRGKGIASTGSYRIDDFTFTKATADHVSFTACLDVADIEVTNRDGSSAVLPSRHERVLIDYSVTKTDGAWRLTEVEPQLTDSNPPEAVPCP